MATGGTGRASSLELTAGRQETGGQSQFVRPGECFTFSNIQANGGTLASSITGPAGHPLCGITMRDIMLTMAGGEVRQFDGSVPEAPGEYPHAPMFGALPASVLYLRHIEGLNLVNVRLRVMMGDARPLAVLDDVRGVRADRLRVGG